jgi:iron complex transport system permease protein
VVAVGGAAAAVSGGTLAALRLGEDTARSLGVRVQWGQAALLGTAVALASVSVAAAGPIPFVALIAPQVALRLARSGGPPQLASGLTGSALVLAGDVLSRTVLPVELPVGVVTAAAGAPCLIFLLVRRTRKDNA